METRDAQIRKSPKIAVSRQGDAGDDGNRINNLPEVIVHYLFSFLETIDVISTSAVSRRWRYLWTSIPYFNFNIKTVWSDKSSFSSLQAMNERFKDFVNWVSSSQDSYVGIHEFRLSCVNFKDDPLVCRWMNIAARRRLRELELTVNSQSAFNLPLSLARCETLGALKLNFKDRILKLPGSSGFARLKSLELRRFELNDENVARDFIRGCPFLKDLSMWNCIFRDLKVLEISSTSLKKLNIDNYIFARSFVGDLCSIELKVACPNLVSFDYMGPPANDFFLCNA